MVQSSVIGLLPRVDLNMDLATKMLHVVCFDYIVRDNAPLLDYIVSLFSAHRFESNRQHELPWNSDSRQLKLESRQHGWRSWKVQRLRDLQTTQSQGKSRVVPAMLATRFRVPT